jgi:hypothetical protein
LEAFGAIPSDWAPFIRITEKESGITLGVYQKSQCNYTLGTDGQTWQDTWTAVDMTEDDKTAKQQKVKYQWSTHPEPDNVASWTFDEITCSYQAPIPMPKDGNKYFWQGTTNSWVILPAYPDDGKQYKLDIPTMTWVLVTQ